MKLARLLKPRLELADASLMTFSCVRSHWKPNESVWRPLTQFSALPYSHWFWYMPALPKLTLLPNSIVPPLEGLKFEISICGNLEIPNRLIPISCGVRACD